MQNKATQLQDLSFKNFIHGEAELERRLYFARTIIILIERDKLQTDK